MNKLFNISKIGGKEMQDKKFNEKKSIGTEKKYDLMTFTTC